MSRSRRKSPIVGHTTSVSEKGDKKIWHGRMRAMMRNRLHADDDPFPVIANEVETPWGMDKDGKQYLHEKNLHPQWTSDGGWSRYRDRLMRK